MQQQVQRVAQYRQVRFAAIGVVNTIIDFGVLNLLVGVLGVPRIPANLMSTSVAMTFSFLANRKFVFRYKGPDASHQAAWFIAGTLFGLYIVQTIVIVFLTEVWLGPVDLAYSVIESLGLADAFTYDFIATNTAKASAVLVTLFWNYWFYKHFVFVDRAHTSTIEADEEPQD